MSDTNSSPRLKQTPGRQERSPDGGLSALFEYPFRRAEIPHRSYQFGLHELFLLSLMAGLIVILVSIGSTGTIGGIDVRFFWVLGFIGFWRYGWKFVHYVRALIYQNFMFPHIRRKARALWESGWRPDRIHIVMVTYDEDRRTTEQAIRAIVREGRSSGVPINLIVGTGKASDEKYVDMALEKYARDVDIHCTFVRQNRPGKRHALGLSIRSLNRREFRKDDPVIVMDGDTILSQGTFRRCLSILGRYPDIDALTTDETCEQEASTWYKRLSELRFHTRDVYMKSHALSKKLTVLTGRMSMFRAKHFMPEEMPEIIEGDSLSHWLWGRFRFLSGDDKSTWYQLLKTGKASLLYVPDALCVTQERVKGSNVIRMLENLLRWSGNMLRNGARAIALGPKCIGGFIWWCLVDQRIAMWTGLISPIVGIGLTILGGWQVMLLYIAWVLLSRTVISLVITAFSGRFSIANPFLMYGYQLTNSLIKIYLLFRLPFQRWTGSSATEYEISENRSLKYFQFAMASYLTTLYLAVFIFMICISVGLIEPLSFRSLYLLFIGFFS